MIYRVSPLNKKNVTEIIIWTNDNYTVKQTIGWRWGAVVCPTKPDLSNYDPEEGIDVYNSGWDADFDGTEDGCYEDWEYDDTMTEEEIEEFQNAYDEDGIEGVENLGWSNDDSELWFIGELEIKEVY